MRTVDSIYNTIAEHERNQDLAMQNSSNNSGQGDDKNIVREIMKDILVIFDAGHSQVTPGKRSPMLPDGSQFFEWEFNNDITNRVIAALTQLGVRTYKVNTENDDPMHTVDVTLGERCRRANAAYAKEGKGNAIYVSIHANAAGNGGWMGATGWSVFCSKNASDSSKRLANYLADACTSRGLKLRKPMPTQKYWQENFYVVKNTNMPAVLTENFFYDNQSDLAFINSEVGRQAVVDIHVQGIINYIKSIS